MSDPCLSPNILSLLKDPDEYLWTLVFLWLWGFLPRENWDSETFVSGSLRFRRQTPQDGGGFMSGSFSSYSLTGSWVAFLAEHMLTSLQFFIYKQLSKNTSDRVIFASVLVCIALPSLIYRDYCFQSSYNRCVIKLYFLTMGDTHAIQIMVNLNRISYMFMEAGRMLEYNQIPYVVNSGMKLL